MDALRLRLAPPSNGVVAAAFLAATVAVGVAHPAATCAAPTVRAAAAPAPRADLRRFRAAVPPARSRFRCCRSATARTSASATPPRAVSDRLGRTAESGREEVDRGRARPAADALLRIRRLPLHRRLRALRDERRAAHHRGHLSAVGGSEASPRPGEHPLSRSPPARRCRLLTSTPRSAPFSGIVRSVVASVT